MIREILAFTVMVVMVFGGAIACVAKAVFFGTSSEKCKEKVSSRMNEKRFREILEQTDPGQKDLAQKNPEQRALGKNDAERRERALKNGDKKPGPCMDMKNPKPSMGHSI